MLIALSFRLVSDLRIVRFLVFAHHQSVLDDLDHFIRSKSMEEVPSYIRIDGKTAAETRQANVDKFQQDEGCCVALLSITAAGTGITLHAASHVVFAELTWTPALHVQAEDRGHTTINGQPARPWKGKHDNALR